MKFPSASKNQEIMYRPGATIACKTKRKELMKPEAMRRGIECHVEDLVPINTSVSRSECVVSNGVFSFASTCFSFPVGCSTGKVSSSGSAIKVSVSLMAGDFSRSWF
jgi:hypothetical protein